MNLVISLRGLAATLVLAALAACGGGSGDSGATSVTQTTAAPVLSCAP